MTEESPSNVTADAQGQENSAPTQVKSQPTQQLPSFQIPQVVCKSLGIEEFQDGVTEAFKSLTTCDDQQNKMTNLGFTLDQVKYVEELVGASAQIGNTVRESIKSLEAAKQVDKFESSLLTEYGRQSVEEVRKSLEGWCESYGIPKEILKSLDIEQVKTLTTKLVSQAKETAPASKEAEQRFSKSLKSTQNPTLNMTRQDKQAYDNLRQLAKSHILN